MIYAVIDTNVLVSAFITKNPIVVTPAEMLKILQREGIL